MKVQIGNTGKINIDFIEQKTKVQQYCDDNENESKLKKTTILPKS